MGNSVDRNSAKRALADGDRPLGRAWLVLAIAATLAATTPGCGEQKRARGVVTGKVTYRGEPLRFGSVIFEPEAGQFATGKIQPDGTFRMTTRGEGDGAPVGKCKVRFVCFANQDPSATPPADRGDGPPSESLPMGPPLIPEKYLSCATSGITVEVEPGENEPLSFNLTDD